MQTILSRSAFLLLTMLFSWSIVSAQTTSGADAITGAFQDTDKGTKFLIYKENDQYFAKVTELGPNPGGKVQVGTIILKNLVYSNGVWSGKLYAPQRDSDFDVDLKLPDNNTLNLKVNAGMMTRNLTWKRLISKS